MAYDPNGEKYYRNDIVDEFKHYMEAEKNKPFNPDHIALYNRIPQYPRHKDKELKELLREVIACMKIIIGEEKAKLDEERAAELEAEEAEDVVYEVDVDARKQFDTELDGVDVAATKKEFQRDDKSKKKEIRGMIEHMRKTRKSSLKATYLTQKNVFELDCVGQITKEGYHAALRVLSALDNNVSSDKFSPVGTGLKQLLSDEHTIKILLQHTEYMIYTPYIEEQTEKINKGWFFGLSSLRKKVDDLIARVKEYLNSPTFAFVRSNPKVDAFIALGAP